MRMAAICFAILTFTACGALAQAPRQAPIGHRQPTLSDLPPDVARKEEQPGEAPPREQIARGRGGGGPPTLRVEPSCEAAGRGAIVLGRNKEACLADETTAQDTLKQNWSKYSAANKAQCVGLEITGGPASYVELLSCLEVMRDAKTIEAADPLAGDAEPVGTRRGKRTSRGR